MTDIFRITIARNHFRKVMVDITTALDAAQPNAEVRAALADLLAAHERFQAALSKFQGDTP